MEDHSGLRRKDTTKGPPLRILSLDGGGIRGYSMLIIVQELMHRTFVELEGRAPRRDEIPKPCDHFDLIAGTGTGGLIAIMLGRLRLDLDTCKDLYVKMTRRVFETDKTLLGLPLRGTMFKATKLEESIKESVQSHTIFEDEGNDSLANAVPMTPNSPTGVSSPTSIRGPHRSMSQSSRYSQIGQSPATNRISFSSLRFGNANALLYDTRETRTKTAVAAVLKGTPVTTFLRSYDSRKETAPDVNCTIWQAGRATCATQMAFKPIQIGQSVYLDEGGGKYNPAPQVLDEAVQNEWPGREVGVFISIGTGKRPPSSGNNQHEWWEGFLGSSVGDFAEARRRLISKLEACEDTHQYMLREHLTNRGVSKETYFRLNVEVGVGEFGMNEWNRLGDISTSTRMYLNRSDVQTHSHDAARKLAKIRLAQLRQARSEARRSAGASGEWQSRPYETRPPQVANAIELPGDDGYQQAPRYEHRPSVADQKYVVVASDNYAPPRSSGLEQVNYVARDGYDQPVWSQQSPFQQTNQVQPARPYPDYPDSRMSSQSFHDSSYRQGQAQDAAHEKKASPPPRPPKTPVSAGTPPQSNRPSPPQPPSWESYPTRTFMNMGDLARGLPYPDTDEGPPPVNTANKPQLSK